MKKSIWYAFGALSLATVGAAVIARGQTQSAASTVQPFVSIAVQGAYRVITSNGLPNHPTGAFPNRGNPNSISAQRYNFRVPVAPKMAEKETPLFLGPFGIAVNGVPFDPGAAEFWNGDRRWQYEPLTGPNSLGVDDNNAHVQPNGAYHYHSLPIGLLEKLGAKNKMTLIGYAADGFPIYGPYCVSDPKNLSSPLKKMKASYRLKKGTRPDGDDGPGGAYDGAFVADFEYEAGLGDLDACNGRTGVTPEYPNGTYYYVVTGAFPFIPRRFKGTPDDSFRRGPGGPGGPGGPPPFPPGL